MSPRLPPLAPAVPQVRRGPGHYACRAFLRLAGWRLEGSLPEVRRLVVIAAPHSSAWDGFWGLLFKVGLGLDLHFMGKRELFRGPLGWVLRRLGGLPVDRQAPHGVVEQMSSLFAGADALWLGLAPEGTRRATLRWRSGFWHIARAAAVPVLPVAFDYPQRRIVVGVPFTPSASFEEDLQQLKAFYLPFRGLRRGIS